MVHGGRLDRARAAFQSGHWVSKKDANKTYAETVGTVKIESFLRWAAGQ